MENTYINKRGYVIKKKFLDEKMEKKIKKDLTVKPFCLSDFQQEEKVFKLYQENENKLYIPKAYGLKILGPPIINTLLNMGDDIDIKFTGKMRDAQMPVIDTFIKAAYKDGGGLVCLGCGSGKTVCGLKIIEILKKKTLIVVHKEFLLNQWIERINEFLPQAKVGIIQQNKINIDEKDIVIAMLQSISMKDYPKDLFDSFGLTIIDECHHLGAEVFSKALPKINSRFMLGLTATPDRKDGMKKVFEYFLGDIVYCVKGREPEEVLVKIIDYYSIDKQYSEEQFNFKGQINSPRMINQISEDPHRIILIINEIILCIKENRKILILSDRRNHLVECKNKIDELNICSTGFYVGGIKQNILKETEEKDVILGTYSMASEGMDIPLLNTVILATPKSDIEQSVGRILRQKKEQRKVIPLIIDIIDQIPNFIRQSKNRIKHYKKSDYNINVCTYPLNNKINTIITNRRINKCINTQNKCTNEVLSAFSIDIQENQNEDLSNKDIINYLS